jgi:hypothetical protein
VIERLRTLKETLPRGVEGDRYLQAVVAGKNSREVFEGIRGYWIDEGEKAEHEGHPDRAYWCYYSAGWDLYCSDDMPEILARLVRTAHSARWTALAGLAEMHLERVAEL